MTKPHYLKPTKTTSSPDTYIAFDTETLEHQDGDDKVMVLRNWVAVTRHRHQVNPAERRTNWSSGTTAEQLIDLIEDATQFTKHLYVYAYNISFDLVVTNLPPQLVDRGWSLTAWSLQSDSSWWILKKDRNEIILSDAWTWTLCPLETVAKEMGTRKVKLPDNDASLDVWHKRCRKDVEILDKMINDSMNWWDKNNLGKWGITGASTGWATLKRMTPDREVVVGSEPGRTSFERRAIYGGRKEVYKVGEINGTNIGDFDFTSAYLITAAHHKLPTQERRVWTEEYIGEMDLLAGDRFVIAEVEVTTKKPVVPVRIAGDVWWPAGHFHTWLCEPDIVFAREQGAEVKLIYGHTYKASTWMRPWASWVANILWGDNEDVPPAVRRMAKAWGRSVVGKFAAHGARVLWERPATQLGWHIETSALHPSGESVDVLTIGNRQIAMAYDTDATDCFPAVTAAVESYTRVALGRMLALRPQDQLVQCNTDGWWETGVPRSPSAEIPDVPWPHRVVRKQLSNNVTVIGPQHIYNHAWKRLAGVPADAMKTEDGAYEWSEWPGLRWQLSGNDRAGYTRPHRRMVLAEHYARRWVLENGETVPAVAEMDDEGTNFLLPWTKSYGRRRTDRLAKNQDPRLMPLRDKPGAHSKRRGDGYAPAPGRWSHKHISLST